MFESLGLNEMDVAMIDTAIMKNFPDGRPCQRNGALAGANELFGTEVYILNHALTKLGKSARVGVDIVKSKNAPPITRGLIIFDGETTIVPVEISQSIVRIADKPFYLLHPKAASDLLLAILTVANSVVAQKAIHA